MNKTPFVPPEIPKLSEKELENLKHYKISDEKKAYIHEKYEKPLQERERNLERKKRSEWWKNNAFNIIATLLAIIGIAIGIIELL